MGTTAYGVKGFKGKWWEANGDRQQSTQASCQPRLPHTHRFLNLAA